MWFFKNKRGQSQVVEYSIIFILILAAIAGMSTYVKRTAQARIRGARNLMYMQVSNVYNQYHPGLTLPAQYEPYYVQTTGTREENATDQETVRPLVGGEGTYRTESNSVVTSSGTSTVASGQFGD